MRHDTDTMRLKRQGKRRLLGACAMILLLSLAALSVSCVRSAGVVFPRLENPIVWPPPPERTRIEWVGELVTSDDLKPGVGLGQAINRAIFGKKEAYSMLSPYAVCTDGQDRIFVADAQGQFVHVFDLDTRKYARWSPPRPQLIAQPVGIAYDPAGRVLVSDSVGACIHVFASDGRYQGTFGSGELRRPAGMAYDAVTRRLLVVDTGAHQLAVFSLDGELLTRIGERGTEPGQFNYPTNVVVDSKGRVYVSDSLNFRVQQFDATFRPALVIGKQGTVPGTFAQPKGIAIDSEDHLYVVDAQFEAVQIFDEQGTLLLTFGQEGRGPGQFWLPAGIFIDPHDRIWVADTYNRRLQVFDYLPENKQ